MKTSWLWLGAGLLAGCSLEVHLGATASEDPGSTGGTTEVPSMNPTEGIETTTEQPATICGDAIVDPGEECDDGNTDSEDVCTAECKLATCGDGFIFWGVEDCDGGPGCDPISCHHLPTGICGNGKIEENEECDNGSSNDDTSYCTHGCKKAVCGDGFVFSGIEPCDDGNKIDQDGCDADCFTSVQRIFVSSMSFKLTDMGSLKGADALCVGAAGNAGLETQGTWRALLASPEGFWKRMNPKIGGIYAETDLINFLYFEGGQTPSDIPELIGPITKTEFGKEMVTLPVWTGLDEDWLVDINACDGWTPGSLKVTGMGQSAFIEPKWVRSGEISCEVGEAHLYCVEVFL